MILNLLINFILLIFSSLFIFLPEVHLSDIPYIGAPLVSGLTYMVGIWNSFMITFPYAVIGWQVFLWVIVPFEILLLVAKFFLGHRLPAHTN